MEIPQLYCAPPTQCPVDEPFGSKIQQDIDTILNKPIENWKSFSITKSRGSLTVPKDVHIRFYDCIFETFNSIEGNNNYYFENCTFKEPPNIQNATFLAKGCIFEKGGYFGRTIGELSSENEFQDTLVIYANSNIKSYKTIFNGERVSQQLGLAPIDSKFNLEEKKEKEMIHVADNSAFEANQDVIKNVNFALANVNNKSYILFKTPSFDFCLPKLNFSRNWKLPEIELPTLPLIPGPCTIPVRLNSYKLITPNISIDNLLAFLRLPTCLHIPAMIGKISCSSVMKIIDGKEIISLDTMFELDGVSSLETQIGNILFSMKSLADLKNGSIAKLNNYVQLQANKLIAKIANYSTMEISKIKNVASLASNGFKVENQSKLKIGNIIDISTTKGKGFDADNQSIINLDNIKRIAAHQEIFNADNGSAIRAKAIQELETVLGPIINTNNRATVQIKK